MGTLAVGPKRLNQHSAVYVVGVFDHGRAACDIKSAMKKREGRRAVHVERRMKEREEVEERVRGRYQRERTRRGEERVC